MKSHLDFISTRSMSREDWLLYRKDGVGASEAAIIMGLSPYKASIELFHEKVGTDLGYNIENINMFMGKEQEDFVAILWQYWDGNEQSVIDNYRANKIIRRCQRVNAYVRNPKYPWLFVSLDRKINRGSSGQEGALEIKTISGYEADKWEGGIPVTHVIQVQTQLLVCEFVFGELATLKDGRRFDVIPFDQSKQIAEGIIDQTHDFWQRVEKGKIITTQIYEARRKYNLKLVEDLTGQLAELEPAPDNSEAYADYLRTKYNKSTAGEREGTVVELDAARKSKAITEQIKGLTEESRLYTNQLKASIGEMERLNFGAEGYVSWKSDINGSRRLMNKVK